MKITDKILNEWRTGLHAGNPWECKALVAMIDAERAKVKELTDTVEALEAEINNLKKAE